MITNLFKPVRIKGIEIRNRFVRSATVEGMATPDGHPDKQLKALYCKLAENDIGLIITSFANIEEWKNYPETIGMVPLLGIHNDSYIDSWSEVVAGVHRRGAKIAMQISHLGRQDNPVLRGGAPIAPSAVPISKNPTVPREMTSQEIRDIQEAFAQASRRVQQAGFDAVQFLGAHGHLINNFMSPHTNLRTDEYGGGIENRARFFTDILKITRELAGPDYPLMMKLNFNDFVDGGLEQDEAVKFAKIYAEAGIDCIEVSGGTLADSKSHIAVKGIHREEQEAYFQTYAKALKEQVTIPVMLVGGHKSPGVMAKIIEDGDADFISMCRPLIREAELINRWKNGDFEKATCISCNQCFENWASHPMRCYVEGPLERPISTAYVVYISPAGTTHRVAEMIAKTLEMSKIETMLFDLGRHSDDTAILEAIAGAKPKSCLFIGSPVYASHAVPSVMRFISRLPEDIVRTAVPFVTWGGVSSGIALSEMANALAKKGKRVAGAAKILAMHSLMWQSDAPLGKGRPNADDDELIASMVRGILKKLSSNPDADIPLTECDDLPAHTRAEMEGKTLSTYQPIMPMREVVEEACTQCKVCADTCPAAAITFTPYPEFGDRCIFCHNCVRLCPESAIRADMSAIEKHIRERSARFNERPDSRVYC